MISLKLLTEGRYDYGCVMAKIDEEAARLVLDFNYQTIAENIIYKEGINYGREQNPHITVKNGLVQSYTEEQMKHLLRNVVPFDIQVKGVSIFEADKYDVVKFDVDSPGLRKLNEMFSMLPNHDEHPEYHPHMTLAYVRKGAGKNFVKSNGKVSRIPVKTIVYSDRGEKTYHNLGEVLHKPVPKILYHGTFNALIPYIEKDGLLPLGGGLTYNFEGIESGVYLAENKNEAGSFVEISENPDIPESWFDEIVIIAIDTTKLDQSKFDVDPNVVQHEGEDNRPFIYRGTIPPSAIVNITDY